MVTQGNIAPDFTLEADRSEKVTLSKPRGSRSCSFYPKDDTPGCKILVKYWLNDMIQSTPGI